jgi:hypothetical protein
VRRLITVALATVTIVVVLVSAVSGVAAQDAQDVQDGAPRGPATSAADLPDASSSASDAGTVSGPLLTPSVRSVEPGQRVDVIFTGWTARYATLSVCGNLAKRGSADCNMVESTGVRLSTSSGDDSFVHDMVVVAPPTDCPCVIRGVGGDNGEVGIAPIDLIGHPISDVVDPNLGQPVVAVDVSTTAVSDGALSSLRQSLGGPSAKEVTVSVRNLTTELLTDVAVHGTVTRSGDTVAEFDLATGEIGPGQTWTGTTEVELPAPAIGTYDWDVSASGAGPMVAASTTTRSIPWLLLLLVLVLVWDLAAVAVRRVQRRRARQQALSVARPVDPELVIDIRDRGVVAGASPATPDDPTEAHEPVGAGSGRGQGAP